MAYDRSWSFAPKANGDGWATAALAINATGTWDRVRIASTSRTHGKTWVSGRNIIFQPTHNGYFTTEIHYWVENSATGKRSNTAVMDIEVYCNESHTCYG